MAKAHSFRSTPIGYLEVLGKQATSLLHGSVHISQRGLARKMKVAQPTLAKVEKQPDMQIATLRKVVRALGGDIDIIARFPKASLCIRVPDLVRRNNQGGG